MASRRRRFLTHDREVFLLALLAGLPASLLVVILLWARESITSAQWSLVILAVVTWLAIAATVRARIQRPLQTISNMLAALREGDFSMRARESGTVDPLGLLLFELNGLGEDLRAQRLGALEATALLRRVMDEIDVAVFAFDGDRVLRLVNPAGATVLGQPQERLLGRPAADIGLESCFAIDSSRLLDLELGGVRRRWEVRRGTFRQGGLAHDLLVLADMSRTLSREEHQAWQRLIRVLSHELNNSLAPIKSIAESLSELVHREPPAPDWRGDLKKGLGIIGSRAESLSRLMAAYARLARLPAPKLASVSVEEWVRRVTALETRQTVTVTPGPPVTIQADGAQLDQLLINLVRNAVDAVADRLVQAEWATRGSGSRRWPWPQRQRQSLCSLLHDKAGRLRNRTCALAPNR
jgi:nitrogen fixation/metabolism regulation signal transduction histidine kinase